LVGSTEAEGWAQFVTRELRDPGPAFEILYERRWRPGIGITARLIARILGAPEDDQSARVQAMLVISSALAFQSERRIVLRTVRWPAIGPDELAMVLSALDAQIDAVDRNLPTCPKQARRSARGRVAFCSPQTLQAWFGFVPKARSILSHNDAYNCLVVGNGPLGRWRPRATLSHLWRDRALPPRLPTGRTGAWTMT
jgi:HTH-type transcriptional dual regulator CecR, C-terminal domain